MDLAVTNKNDDNVLILLGDGNGNFAPAAAAAPITVGALPVAMLSGDFDGNKCPDLAGASLGAAASLQGGTVFVLLGQLGGGFLGPFFYDAGLDPTDGSVTVLLNNPVCPWDCGDQDGGVGVVDFLALLSQWGQAGTPCDFDGGVVGVTDFLALLAHWGPCP